MNLNLKHENRATDNFSSLTLELLNDIVSNDSRMFGDNIIDRSQEEKLLKKVNQENKYTYKRKFNELELHDKFSEINLENGLLNSSNCKNNSNSNSNSYNLLNENINNSDNINNINNTDLNVTSFKSLKYK